MAAVALAACTLWLAAPTPTAAAFSGALGVTSVLPPTPLRAAHIAGRSAPLVTAVPGSSGVARRDSTVRGVSTPVISNMSQRVSASWGLPLSLLAVLAGVLAAVTYATHSVRRRGTRPVLQPLLWAADPNPHTFAQGEVAMAATTGMATNSPQRLTAVGGDIETDVVVIGSGIGGLCCAALLAHNGLRVTVLESHEHLGGCAHEFKYGPYVFESGPSLYSGFTSEDGSSFNPLAHVFQIIGESPEWIKYDRWGTFLPEGNFCVKLGPEEFEERVLRPMGGEDALAQWRRLMARLVPLSVGAQSLPATVLREDLGALPILLLRYPKAVLATLRTGQELNRPFSKLLDEENITNEFIRNWLDLLCFLLQGLPAKGCLNAVMSYMMADWYRPGVCLDYPKGGSGGIVNALVRGVTKHPGTQVFTEAHVTEVLVSEAGVATGVKVATRKGESVVVRATKAVVCNADLWNTRRLVPPGRSEAFDAFIDELYEKTPQVNSFIHLHAAIDGEGLPKEASEAFPAQWAVVNTWAKGGEGVEEARNVVLVSMPSLLDPSLAPAGKHVIHAYTPATEAYRDWEGLDRASEAYKAKKEAAADFLWRAVEKSVPGARQRCVLELVGSPLTHERFLRRDRGTYGPRIVAGGSVAQSGHKTPLRHFYMTGDSTFPGIGVPAVAAAGAITANTILSIPQVWRMADRIKLPTAVSSVGPPSQPSISAAAWTSERGRRPTCLAAEKREMDFIESMVAKIFGEQVLDDPEPLGLKRMTKEQWPDQWPPTLELADPLEGDQGEVVVLRPLLKQTVLERLPLGLVFDAEADGWSNKAFQEKVHAQGAAVLVAKTAKGVVFGGYNPKGWLGYGEQRDTVSAFLFCWPDGDMTQPAIKLPKIDGGSNAILDEPGQGPRWGPDGLMINLDKHMAKSRLGTYYERMPDGSRSVLGGKIVEVVEVRVYVATEQTELQRNFQPSLLQWQPAELERFRQQDTE
eukprot:EG_transcript_1721